MGFINSSSKQSTVLLEVAESPKLVRPVAHEPKAIWVHKVPSLATLDEAGKVKEVIRGFKYEVCTSNGRSGSGCFLCTTSDPMWSRLPQDNQYNRKGQRVDFPKTCRFLLPVYSHQDGMIFVMEGGNQLFEEMDKWYDLQSDSQKDLRRCDWQVWKVIKGNNKRNTEYKSMRLDASVFKFTDEQIEDAKRLLGVALATYTPTNPNQLSAFINGQANNRQGQTNNQLDQSPVQSQLPAGTVTLPSVTVVNDGTKSTPVFLNPTQPVSTTGLKYPAQPVQLGMPANVSQSNSKVPAAKQELDTFMEWMSAQPRLQGNGMLDIFMPSMQTVLGHVEFNKATSEELVKLKTYISSKL